MAKILKGRFYKLGRDDFEIILSGFFSSDRNIIYQGRLSTNL